MTTAAAHAFFSMPKLRFTRTADAAARTDPPTPRCRAPVFIHDAATPWRGETLLSAMLRADMARLSKDDAES
jgi:hypothetical protein